MFLRRVACGLAALALPAFPAARADDARRPNIVFILTDDQGYADLGCFGSTAVKTPNVDRMAVEGMKLADFYAAPVCSPSRASLMTGCYPRRIGMDRPGGKDVLFPGQPEGLNPSEITIAELLRGQGYATACIGKWHLGDQPPFLPTKRGFDYYFGIPFSNNMANAYGLPPLPHTMPHAPVAASEKFRGRTTRGAYGDSIEEIDWSTGQILDALKQLGLDDKTLVFYVSDNGGPDGAGDNEPLHGNKGSTQEGGIRVCAVARWPGKIPAGTVCKAIASNMDILPTFAKLAGAEAPKDRTLDGIDLWPLLSGRAGAKGRETPKLYDLEKDIGEATDVAAQNPDAVKKLMGCIEKCREDLGDRDVPGKNCRPVGYYDDAKTLTVKQPKANRGKKG